MQKKLYIILVVILVGFLTVYEFVNYTKPNAVAKPNVLPSVAELKSLPTSSGAVVNPSFNLDEVKGSYFVLHFWAKWCEPCADEIPTLVEFTKKAQFSKPFKVLAVSLDPTLEDAKQILPEKGANLPANFILVLDPDHKIAEKIGSYQYPESYFVNPKGEVLEKWIGPQKWQKPEVFEFFKARMI